MYITGSNVNTLVFIILFNTKTTGMWSEKVCKEESDVFCNIALFSN